MNRTLLIAGLAVSAALAAHAQSIEGDWQGTLKAGPAELHLALHFASDGQGGFRGTMDSLDQGAKGIPISSISVKGSTLNWGIGSAGISYDGKIGADGQTTQGTFVQAGQSFPLDFKRVMAAAAAKPP